MKAAIPMAMEYDHIHFGVWAALGDPDKKTGLQKLTDLGIGFVQSISDDGVTERLGIGTADLQRRLGCRHPEAELRSR